MKCPKCKGIVKVIATVDVSCNEIYRERECRECGHKFYTAEFEVEPNKRFRREWALYSFKRNNKV